MEPEATTECTEDHKLAWDGEKATEHVCTCQPVKTHKKSVKNFSCVVYTGEARYDKNIITSVCTNFKNFTYTNLLKQANLLWYGRGFRTSDLELCLQIKGIVNRIPGAELFSEKHTQARILNQLHELFPTDFSFHPESFVLPKDNGLLTQSIKEHPKKYLIAKPAEGCGGDGIFLFKSLKDLSLGKGFHDLVVQRYVPNPLLINGKKWDMRVYVLVHGVSPMKAYLATDFGLARFCTEDYDMTDSRNVYSHLTNYCLNKNSKNYVKDQVLDEESKVNNSKMSLADAWRLVEKHYPEVDIDSEIKQKIRDLVVNVLIATRSTIELRYVEHIGQKEAAKSNHKFFQILGFDIMFDDCFNPWLFEVNAYPSMNIFFEKDNPDGTYSKEASEVDEKIKTTVFAESARILLGNRDSEVFDKVYDSENSTDNSSVIYETVFEIYKKLWGVKLSQTITISKFAKLANFLSQSKDTSGASLAGDTKLTKTDLELLFTKLQFEDQASIGLISFFSAMKVLAGKCGTDIVTLANEIRQNIGD